MEFEQFNNYELILEKHKQNVENYFNQLVSESGIDVSNNEKTVNKIDKLEYRIYQNNSIIKRNKVGKGFFIFFAVSSILLLVFFNLVGFLNISKLNDNGSIIQLLFIIGWTVMLPIFVGSILLIVLLFNKRINASEELIQKLETELEEKTDEAYAQIAPLIHKMDYGFFGKLVNQVLPVMKFDKNFTYERYNELVENYGLKIKNLPNITTQQVQSGTLFDYPFFFLKQNKMTMGEETYFGSLSISWTETKYIGNQSITITKHENLHASVTKPCPFYEQKIKFYFAHDMTPNLCFSRKPSEINGIDLSEKKYDKFMKKLEKSNDKKYRDLIKINPNFQLLSNTEFEGLFGAFNRNNEIEYRIMFTPLAQSQMLKLFKKRDYTFGDDYSIVKRYKITSVNGEFLEELDLFDNPDKFYNYDFNKVKTDFINYSIDNFHKLYMAIAPVLAVPAYSLKTPVIKPPQYDKQFGNYSYFQHEESANHFNSIKSNLQHSDTDTDVIIKTDYHCSTEEGELVNVTASSFQKVERTDYISRLGGDGYYHDVPVKWIEYIPLEKYSTLLLKESPHENFSDVYDETNEENDGNEYLHHILTKYH